MKAFVIALLTFVLAIAIYIYMQDASQIPANSEGMDGYYPVHGIAEGDFDGTGLWRARARAYYSCGTRDCDKEYKKAEYPTYNPYKWPYSGSETPSSEYMYKIKQEQDHEATVN